ERAEYYRETAALELAGGGFMDFKRLADRIDAKLDSTVITDAAQVQETTAFIQQALTEVTWLPQVFRDILAGKTYLPRRKLRAGLLRPEQGFMGTGRYRQHFFGTTDVPRLISGFIREKMRYSRSKSLNRQAVH
ncbi:MAG: NAD(P)/FAD-dependent oxidoreductase, partial [Deinococcota bacterium]